MLTLQPINIVEPFNHKRKGHTNEYKVSNTPQSFGTCNRLVAACCGYTHARLKSSII